LVIIYISQESLIPMTVTKDGTNQTKFGAIKHNEVIGRNYGSKYVAARGYVYLLFPTPELWSLSLPHRTQILYATDIARIVFELNLTPGKVVCESGTGSGSLSHALIRSIAPSGHLYTVEFHAERAKTAEREFAEHGIGEQVSVFNRDVIQDGFPPEVDHKADAVFFDIPAPYAAIAHVKRALKFTGGEFANFSPCIEQVQQTCEQLRREGFVEIKTVELINHPMTVKTTAMAIPDFGVDMEELVEAGVLPDALSNPDIGYFSRRDGKRLKKAKTMSITTEDPVEVGEVKMSEMNFNVKSMLAKKSKYGHTGYLTFAFLPPREAPASDQ